MHKITCLRCENVSYTAARDTHLPCPYCGLIIKAGELERRVGDRLITQKFCDIQRGTSKFMAKTVDVSDTGVGIKALGHLPFNQDETVNVYVQDLDIEKRAQVVWTKHIYGISRAGLRFC